MRPSSISLLIKIALVLLTAIPAVSQQMNPQQIRGTAVVQTAAGTQTIVQPAGTSLNVNVLNNVRSVLGYGAKCDGVTNDTTAFQSAMNAANVDYAAGKGIQTVTVAGNCRIDGEVSVKSGTTVKGPATITVPVQTGLTFISRSTDYVTIEGLTINITTPGSGPIFTAIAWFDNGDSVAHRGWYVRDNVVSNSSWGILAYYAINGGTGSLSDVDISNNTVSSPTAYNNADGIHVAGRVSNITIHDNRVYNRGDAGIALTSELVGSTLYVLSGAKVSNNVLLEDRVGLDNSGATNAEWTGNYVRSTLPTPGVSNPAFRSISYPGNFTVNPYPTGVHAFNNYLYSANNSGVEVVAKIDATIPGQSAWPLLNSSFEKNVIDGPNNPLYVAGRGVSVGDNMIVNGGAMTVVYDGVAALAATNIIIGSNKWMAAGAINFGGNCALYSNINLRPQATISTLTYANVACIGQQTFSVDNLAANTATIFAGITSPGITGSTSNSVTIRPGTGAANALVVQDNPTTTNLMVLGPTGDINFPSGPLHWGSGVLINSSSQVPQTGAPTANQAACIKATGPPVIIGYCSTVVSAGGACTCL